jgi:hypothetical protein
MSSVVISGDTSGAITLSAPAVAGTNTITLPAATGTAMVSGNMPAFSAYLSANQNISNFVSTKIALNTEIFDTANAFDSTTNYRFTPQVAGYYQVNLSTGIGGTSVVRAFCSIYKNGSEYCRGTDINSLLYGVVVSSLIYLNGSTDYIEFYGFISATSGNNFGGGQVFTQASASLMRGA